MIQIEFSPTEIPVMRPTEVSLNITNMGKIAVSKLFLAIALPQSVKLLQGPRRIEVAQLEPNETYTVALQLISEQEGFFSMTSTNFSYRKGNVGQRIKDLQVPLKFTRLETTLDTKFPDKVYKESSRVSSHSKHVETIAIANKAKAFISYSQKDQGFARHLAKSLSLIGMDVWIDIDDIRAGIKWSTAIQNALKSSNIMIVILSSDSMSSVNVEDEWQYFLDQKKTIIPVLWKKCDIHFQLSRLQYIDFSGQDFNNAFDKLLNEMTRLNIIRQQPDSSKTMRNSTAIELEKIRILFLSANPISTSRLRLDEEIREIDNHLLLSKYRDRFDIKEAWAVRYGDLSRSLQRYEPHIVHFSGHGSKDGAIIVEDEHGNAHLVSGTSLARLFRVFKNTVLCVVLNACWSMEQANAIAGEIDVVIGMKQSIGDKTAINFASGFYQALGYGQNVKDAFELGCIEIDLASLKEENTPKILIKDGVNLKRFF